MQLLKKLSKQVLQLASQELHMPFLINDWIAVHLETHYYPWRIYPESKHSRQLIEFWHDLHPVRHFE